MSEMPKPEADGRVVLHPNSPEAKGLELYQRMAVMAAKRNMQADDMRMFIALCLASDMLQAPEKPGQINRAKRVVDRAWEIIDLQLLVAEYPEADGQAGGD